MPPSDEAGPSQASVASSSRESNVISEVNKKSLAAFTSQYLTLLPKNFRSRHSTLMRNKMSTRGGSLDEGRRYRCLITMLNYASVMVHGHPPKQTPTSVYRHSYFSPDSSPKKIVDKPDFCAVEDVLVPTLTTVPEGNYTQVPWHKTESVGEMRTSLEDAKTATEVMKCTGSHNVARPDRPGYYALSVSPKGYKIGWSDPSGLDISATIAWDYEKVPTVSLADRTTDDSPLWNIQFIGKSYTNAQIVFVGGPWSRQSAIYKFEDDDGESELYCLTIGSHSEEFARVKKRLLMSSDRETLDKVPTIKMFLMSIYDILEAHRYGVMKKRGMHRDVSYRNILVNPFGIPVEGPAEPTFVNTILDSPAKRHPPVALLCDLDNGCVYGEESESDIILEHLKSRTGTPMYIARAVETGRPLVASSPFQPMPELSSKAIAKRYAECYREDTMRTFRDKEGTFHDDKPDIPRYNKIRCNDDQAKAGHYHQPRHDVESVGWCIIVFCLRSQPEPKDEEVEDLLEDLHKAWVLLSRPGPREIVLGMTPQEWEQALHPRLKFLGAFLFICANRCPRNTDFPNLLLQRTTYTKPFRD
ncbi:hypothetical protein F5146DRAFT_1182098 [Armillaria mellea]|nr:hypothetical protein F5146DRAFT_1182098 [Armillaria mellea]